jgi:hypothetical protein
MMHTTPAKFFPDWRPVPSGKVSKTVRKDHLWWLPSGISRQERNDTKSQVSLTENRQGPFPDSCGHQERSTTPVPKPSIREVFPDG